MGTRSQLKIFIDSPKNHAQPHAPCSESEDNLVLDYSQQSFAEVLKYFGFKECNLTSISVEIRDNFLLEVNNLQIWTTWCMLPS